MKRQLLAALALALTLTSPAAARPLSLPALEQLRELSGAGALAPAPLLDRSSRALIFQSLLPPTTDGLTADQMMMIYGTSRYIAENYIDPVEAKRMYVGAMKGMAAAIDPYTAYFTAEEWTAWNSQLTGSFVGIGILGGTKAPGEALPVKFVFKDSPAEKAGLKAKDLIVAVDGTDILPLTREDAIKKLAGAKGTKVSLKVKRTGANGAATELTLTPTRGEVATPETYAKLLSGAKGYLFFDVFGYDTHAAVLADLRALKKQGMKSLIIDIRGNGGGSLTTVAKIASLFLKKGQVIVTEKDRAGNVIEFKAGADGEFKDLPVKLLVNGDSASASEILAACLQDHKRATIIGSRTYGKGLVQKTIALADGGVLKLTVQRWYTPLGRSIQKDAATGIGGVVPDVEVKVSEDDEAKLAAQLYRQMMGMPAEKDDIADPVLAAALK